MHRQTLTRNRLPRKAFTLVELLIVVGLITLMMAFVIPAVKNITSGWNLTAAASEVLGSINLARERATSSNHNVSLRFYPAGNVAGAAFTSYQIWEQTDLSNPSAWLPLDKIQELETGFVVDPDPSTFSPILALTTGSDTRGIYSAIYFTPNGSITAPVTQACLTIHSATAPKTGKVSGLPADFATINIEPFNGRPKLFRP